MANHIVLFFALLTASFPISAQTSEPAINAAVQRVNENCGANETQLTTDKMDILDSAQDYVTYILYFQSGNSVTFTVTALDYTIDQITCKNK